jgi:hypothetical protein
MPFHKNLKKLVHVVKNRQFISDPIFIYINIFINRFKIIESLKICYLQYDVPCSYIGLLVTARICYLNKNAL